MESSRRRRTALWGLLLLLLLLILLAGDGAAFARNDAASSPAANRRWSFHWGLRKENSSPPHRQNKRQNTARQNTRSDATARRSAATLSAMTSATAAARCRLPVMDSTRTRRLPSPWLLLMKGHKSPRGIDSRLLAAAGDKRDSDLEEQERIVLVESDELSDEAVTEPRAVSITTLLRYGISRRWRALAALVLPVIQQMPKTGIASSAASDPSGLLASAPPPPGTASIASEILTLTKAIVGAGVLGLPAGLATFYTASFGTAAAPATSTSVGRALVGPSLVLIAAIGAASAAGFDAIAAVCAATRSASYRQAWARTIGPDSAWVPALACLLVTSCTTVTCGMVLRSTLGPTGFLGVALLGLSPLCWRRELKHLLPFSFVGTAGMLYTALVMALRCVTGAYAPDARLGLWADLPPNARPVLDGLGVGDGWKPWLGLLNIKKAAILISMLSTSFMAHYNAPKLYWELRNATPARFRRVVVAGFGAAVALMAAVALSGFLTFGAAAAGMILDSYAPTDGLAVLARAAVTLSVVFTFPLAFVGVRDGAFDLVGVSEEKRRRGPTTPAATLIGLGLITTLALTLKDIRLVLAVGGSTWGMCLIYLFPALMVMHGAETYPVLQPRVPLARLLGTMGLVVGSMGIYRTVTTLL